MCACVRVFNWAPVSTQGKQARRAKPAPHGVALRKGPPRRPPQTLGAGLAPEPPPTAGPRPPHLLAGFELQVHGAPRRPEARRQGARRGAEGLVQHKDRVVHLQGLDVRIFGFYVLLCFALLCFALGLFSLLCFGFALC